MPTTPVCSNCVYNQLDASTGKYFCTRYPPTEIPYRIPLTTVPLADRYPQVKADDIACGEFAKK